MELKQWITEEAAKVGSENKLATLASINRATIRNWRNGDIVVKPETLANLAKYMDKSTEEVREEFQLKDFAAEQSRKSLHRNRTQSSKLPVEKNIPDDLYAEISEMKRQISILNDIVLNGKSIATADAP